MYMCMKAELWLLVGFLLFSTLFHNFAGISPESHQIHWNFIRCTRTSPEFRQIIESEHPKKEDSANSALPRRRPPELLDEVQVELPEDVHVLVLPHVPRRASVLLFLLLCLRCVFVFLFTSLWSAVCVCMCVFVVFLAPFCFVHRRLRGPRSRKTLRREVGVFFRPRRGPAALFV